MKKVIVALALAAGACAAPAFAGNVGFALSVGEPGFYGQILLGDWDRPLLVNARPVIERRGYGWVSPVYLRVPDAHRRNWGRYCSRYDACARPVYFVRDDWYRNEYAPRYRRAHGRDHGYDRYHDRGHRRNDYRGHDRREDRGHDRNDFRGRDGGDSHDRSRDGGKSRGDNRDRGQGRH